MVLALVTPDVGKSVDLENLLHRTFPGKRIGGEWFKAKDEGGSFVADYVNYLESVFKEEIH